MVFKMLLCITSVCVFKIPSFASPFRTVDRQNVLGADRGAGGESGMGSTSGMSGGGLSGGVGVRGQRRSVAQRGTVSAIEMDIERLFSKRVQIFSAVSFNDAADVLLGTVLKASFKASIEAVRVMTLPFPAYIQIQANITFLKQVRMFLFLNNHCQH